MAVFNRIKEYLELRPDPITGASVTSAYRFWKETGLSRATAYRIYNDPSYVPTGEVLNSICNAYKEQPGVFLIWVPDKQEENANDRKPDKG